LGTCLGTATWRCAESIWGQTARLRPSLSIAAHSSRLGVRYVVLWRRGRPEPQRFSVRTMRDVSTYRATSHALPRHHCAPRPDERRGGEKAPRKRSSQSHTVFAECCESDNSQVVPFWLKSVLATAPQPPLAPGWGRMGTWAVLGPRWGPFPGDPGRSGVSLPEVSTGIYLACRVERLPPPIRRGRVECRVG